MLRPAPNLRCNNRTSAAKAAPTPKIYGTAEAVPFVHRHSLREAEPFVCLRRQQQKRTGAVALPLDAAIKHYPSKHPVDGNLLSTKAGSAYPKLSCTRVRQCAFCTAEEG
jgi:hypothetical protein